MIAIVDYGMGNLASISNILKAAGSESVVTNDASIIRSASKLILPGVGAFDAGMRNLHRLGLVPLLEEFLAQRPEEAEPRMAVMERLRSVMEPGSRAP